MNFARVLQKNAQMDALHHYDYRARLVNQRTVNNSTHVASVVSGPSIKAELERTDFAKYSDDGAV